MEAINDNNNLEDNKKHRLTKDQKRMYIDFLMREDIKEILKTIPKRSQLRFLREAFEKETGIKISRHIAYLIKPYNIPTVIYGGQTYIVC